MIKDHLKNLGKITYLILIERSEVSHFNQYEKLKITQQDIIKHILTLPKDIYEIYMNKEKIVYQRSKGLAIDGIVGCNTWRALQEDVVGTGATNTTIN